jgi:hypothetical protein
MKNKPSLVLLIILMEAVLHVRFTYAAFDFVPGDYYSSNYFSNVITQYNSNGDVVGSYTLPSSYGSEVRGLTFGPDSLLYATVITDTGFSVLA